MFGIILATVIELTGVTGTELRSRAYFDANNVLVGDPLVLTVDFLGEADFSSLHPPALSKVIDRRDWKVDDVSAKTSTYRDARRLTYRIRPMREGVLWFPALEFSYLSPDGELRKVKSNIVPVHAKLGVQVVVEEIGEADEKGFPKPPELIETADVEGDERFRWEKALAHPTADAFAQFDFPAAKMNEATCAIREGNWSRAMSVYRVLEWRIGQTAAIERGIVAAEALRYENPSAVLPVWREVGRPVLKYGWKGRLGIVAGALAAFALLLWLVGRGIRALACLAFVCAFVLSAGAQQPADAFESIHRQFQIMRQQMNQMSAGFPSFSIGNDEVEKPKVKASLKLPQRELRVGDAFEFVLLLETPKNCSISQLRISPSERFGMKVTGQAENMTDGVSDNPSNIVKRISVPVRYDVPFKGKISLHVEGMISGQQQTNRRRSFFSSFTFSNSFAVNTPPAEFEIKSLPSAGQPEDFGGVVSEGLTLVELPDLLTPETNDVIVITYRMRAKGYVPVSYLPKDVAFEWTRDEDSGTIEYRRFFVADGAPTTPELSVSYYDPRLKKYRTVKSGGTAIRYRRPQKDDKK